MRIRPSRYLMLLVWATGGLISFFRIQWPVVPETWGHDPVLFVGNLLTLIFAVGLFVAEWTRFVVEWWQQRRRPTYRNTVNGNI